MKCDYCLLHIERVASMRKECPHRHQYHSECLRKWKTGGCPCCVLIDGKMNDLFVSNRPRYDDLEAMLRVQRVLE